MRFHFEKQRRGLAVVAAVGLVWAVALAGDWTLRFARYHWQQTFVFRPGSYFDGPAAPLQSNTITGVRGGDLSHLIGLPFVAQRFEEVRPEGLEQTDEFGYRNVPPTKGVSYPIVTVGASYMNSGYPMTNMFSARLAALTGLPVYNHAFAGRGPFFGLIRFLEEERFLDHPPKVLVWGIVEREVGRTPFDGVVYHLEHPGWVLQRGPATPRILWEQFRPASLHHTLPDSSAVAQAARRTWDVVRYAVFRKITSDVIISSRPIGSRPFLMYGPAIMALRWTPQERAVDHVADAIGQLDAICRTRGTRLVIVLIPDKEQVYREYLPDSVAGPDHPLPESCLYGLESLLRDKGISVVNMLDPYRALAEQGEFLYWRDDTHWSADAIELAAEAVQRQIGPRLTDSP